MSKATHKVPVGGVVLGTEPLEINAGRERTLIKVRNVGDRPIQVGSHYHFFEVNKDLEFDREKAFGKRLDIPATTAIRFEPGDEKELSLVPYAGKQRVVGFNNLVDGWVGNETDNDYRPRLDDAMSNIEKFQYHNKKED